MAHTQMPVVEVLPVGRLGDAVGNGFAPVGCCGNGVDLAVIKVKGKGCDDVIFIPFFGNAEFLSAFGNL